jgi:hypothetical protein
MFKKRMCGTVKARLTQYIWACCSTAPSPSPDHQVKDLVIRLRKWEALVFVLEHILQHVETAKDLTVGCRSTATNLSSLTLQQPSIATGEIDHLCRIYEEAAIFRQQHTPLVFFFTRL